MFMRALICSLLLIAQPLLGVAYAWQLDAGDQATEHCASAVPTGQDSAGAEQGSHTDTGDCMDSGNCNMCAGCATLAVLDEFGDTRYAVPEHGVGPARIMPPGVTSLLYRPPISS